MTAAPHPFIIRHDGRDLAGLEWGSGDDHVVLLHPNGFCAGLFDPLARRLATDHHVVAVDLAGQGCSSAPSQDDLTFTRLRSEEHTSEPQPLMHITYALLCLKKKKNTRRQ